MRQIALGDDIDTDRISATYANGVLTVTLPVAERAKPRRVEISVEDGSQAVETNKQSEISA